MVAVKQLDLINGSSDFRNSYINKVEVLNKIKQLQYLPYQETVTTEKVAEFYEVEIEAIKKITQRHNEEFTSDGLKVYSGMELRDIKSLCGIHTRARSLMLFTKKSILRVGMLLRDSEVAKQVRNYLIETEEEHNEFKDISEKHKMLISIILAKDDIQRATIIGQVKDKIEGLETEVKHLNNKWNQIVSDGVEYSFEEVAALLSKKFEAEGSLFKITTSALTAYLRNKEVLSKSKSGKAYKNLPRDEYKEYFNRIPRIINTNGYTFNKSQTMVNNSGLSMIYDLLIADELDYKKYLK